MTEGLEAMSAESVSPEALAPLARAELARRRLADLLGLLVPGYERARHADALCAALEALEEREIRRLLVQMPPRHGKTLHVSQGFPAWWLGRHPTDSIILASYGGLGLFATARPNSSSRTDRDERVGELYVDPVELETSPN